MSDDTPPGLSEDALLGGRLRILQPRLGARVAIDTLLLAASVDAAPGARVIEAGSGTGAAALALALRCPEARVTGIEIDSDLVDLARTNARLNGMADRVDFLCAGITERPVALGRRLFDHAFANPPYYEAGGSIPPAQAGRARAFVGGEATLSDWIAFCLDMVRDRGRIHLIHRVDSLDALMAALAGRAGDIVLCPLWPRAGAPAKRVLLSARKGTRGAASLLPGLVLHDASGNFTPEADAILRGAAGLDLGRAAGARIQGHINNTLK